MEILIWLHQRSRLSLILGLRASLFSQNDASSAVVFKSEHIHFEYKMCACAYANANFRTQIYIFISFNCVCLFVYACLCEPKAAIFVSQQKTQRVSQFLA